MKHFHFSFPAILILALSLLIQDIRALQAQSVTESPPVTLQYATPALSVFDSPEASSSAKSENEILNQLKFEQRRLQTRLQTRTARQCLGNENIALLSTATRVEVFHIRPRLAYEYDAPVHLDPSVLMDGSVLVSTGKDQGKEFASHLAAAVMDDQAYRVVSSLSEFRPRIVFRAWSGNRYVDVLMEFPYGDFSVLPNGNNTRSLDATVRSARHPNLADLAKEAFPGDVSIQTDKRPYP